MGAFSRLRGDAGQDNEETSSQATLEPRQVFGTIYAERCGRREHVSTGMCVVFFFAATQHPVGIHEAKPGKRIRAV